MNSLDSADSSGCCTGDLRRGLAAAVRPGERAAAAEGRGGGGGWRGGRYARIDWIDVVFDWLFIRK